MELPPARISHTLEMKLYHHCRSFACKVWRTTRLPSSKMDRRCSANWRLSHTSEMKRHVVLGRKHVLQFISCQSLAVKTTYIIWVYCLVITLCNKIKEIMWDDQFGEKTQKTEQSTILMICCSSSILRMSDPASMMPSG